MLRVLQGRSKVLLEQITLTLPSSHMANSVTQLVSIGGHVIQNVLCAGVGACSSESEIIYLAHKPGLVFEARQLKSKFSLKVWWQVITKNGIYPLGVV